MPAHQCQEAGINGPRAQGGIPGRGGGRAERVPDLEEVAGEQGLGDGSRVDADTLAHGDEVRRDEEARPARAAAAALVLRQDGIDKGARAAFAFGAGDVHDVEPIQIGRLDGSASRAAEVVG